MLISFWFSTFFSSFYFQGMRWGMRRTYLYIRHVPLGTCCVSRSIGSSIHSLSSTSFQVELGAPGGGGSSSPFLWSFLRGGTRDPLPVLAWRAPTPGLQKSNFFANVSHFALLFANLGAKMSKHHLR